MGEVEKNQFFKRAIKKASEILKSNPRLRSVVDKASHKINDFSADNIKTSGFVSRLNIFIRMVKAYAKGEYREIEWQNIVLVVAALLYFITPLDFIPDFIPVTGFVDDFTVLVWVYNKIQNEIDSFQTWESNEATDVKPVE
ncbi:MAG: YkvA family protein [Bacteroidota bacterium]